MTDGIFIGAGPAARTPQVLDLKRANRHGLIAGATGTGKTVTLQGLVEGFSAAGVPCFVADVKGDLSGLAMAGSPTGQDARHLRRARGRDRRHRLVAMRDTPVQFWDLFGEQGHPIRTTDQRDGAAAARAADGAERGAGGRARHRLPRRRRRTGCCCSTSTICRRCWPNARGAREELTTTYGNVSKQSVGAIQRSLLQLRSAGRRAFLRRARARHRRLPDRSTTRAAASSTSSPPTS